MTAKAADIVVMHCDQGMGTLVRIWEEIMGDDQLRYLCLFDLGTESVSAFDGLAIDNVINGLKKMDDPMLDLVVISHQDKDHWSLLPKLLARIKKDVNDTTLGKYFRGGLDWKDKAAETVEEFGDHFGVTCEAWTATVGNYYEPKKNNPGRIANFADVRIRLLTVNADSTKSIENGTSAVLVVDFGGSRSIIPGDATSQTLAEINEIVDAWEKANGDVNPIRPCYVMSAPHHGALATISDNFKTDKPKLNIADEFAFNTKTEWIAASAGYLSKFWHPYKNVMNLLGYRVGTEATKHNFVWFNQDTGKWEEQKNTRRQMFTTVTNLEDPPDIQSWVFTMYDSGTVTFRSERTPRGPEDILPPPPDPGVSGPDPGWLAEQQARLRTAATTGHVKARPREVLRKRR